jgi:GNAT superfamily N-acetyltransferase
VHVRRAVLDDARRIAEIHVLAWQVGYRWLLPQPLLDGLHPDQRVPRWMATLERADWPVQGTLLLEHEGVALGFADLGPTRDEDRDAGRIGEITSFYVLPGAWGLGVGRRLMASAVHTLGAAGFAFATLWVLETNAAAIGFYARLGWEPDGAVRDDVAGGAAIRDVRYGRAVG